MSSHASPKRIVIASHGSHISDLAPSASPHISQHITNSMTRRKAASQRMPCRYVGLWTSGGLYGIWHALAGTIVVTVSTLGTPPCICITDNICWVSAMPVPVLLSQGSAASC